jgi:hypothetical protein
MVEAYLNMAAAMISEAVVGTRYDQLHGLKTAHLLATSPGGINVRLVQKDGSTTYSNAFKEAALSKVAAPMVV